ncbi:MAG: ATP-binding protein [Fretibacterium sp.]|nr:ATP-binding protein [Fretibacterium sp.]
MAGSGDIQKQLRAKNPFASSVSPAPWSNANPDLESLNREATNEIEQLIRDKRREPSVPRAGLILGMAGAGKTHMLRRILLKLRGKGQIAVFVAVRAFLDPESVIQYLLKEAVISLGREHRKGRTQLDIVMEELDSAYRDSCLQDGAPVQEGLERLRPLHREMSALGEVERNVLKSLLLYAGTQDADIREDILLWLRGKAEEGAVARLGLPERDLESMTEHARENDARTIFLSLGQIFAYAKVPMIVCFDQLDGMEEKKLINAWGQVVSLLVNDTPGVLPLAFLRADTWYDHFANVLDIAVIQRLGKRPILMQNCTLEQAQMLIKSRLETFFGEDVEEKYQWLMERLKGRLQPGYSPRMVIDLAGHVIDESDGDLDPVLKPIDAAYREECDKVAADLDAWPADADQLFLALQTWINSQENFSVAKKEDRYPHLSGSRMIEGRKVDCDFIVMAPVYAASAAAGLKRGIDFLQKTPNGLGCYIIDGRTLRYPPKWRQVHRLLDEFRELGGIVLLLKAEECVLWYGLVALMNKLDNGDITIYPYSGAPRSANHEDLNRYMKEAFSVDFLNMGKASRDNKERKNPLLSLSRQKTHSSSPDDEALVDILISLLDASPMKLLPAGKMLEMLAARAVEVPQTRLLACVSRFQDRFHVYPAGKDTLIQRAGR